MIKPRSWMSFMIPLTILEVGKASNLSSSFEYVTSVDDKVKSLIDQLIEEKEKEVLEILSLYSDQKLLFDENDKDLFPVDKKIFDSAMKYYDGISEDSIKEILKRAFTRNFIEKVPDPQSDGLLESVIETQPAISQPKNEGGVLEGRPSKEEPGLNDGQCECFSLGFGKLILELLSVRESDSTSTFFFKSENFPILSADLFDKISCKCYNSYDGKKFWFILKRFKRETDPNIYETDIVGHAVPVSNSCVATVSHVFKYPQKNVGQMKDVEYFVFATRATNLWEKRGRIIPQDGMCVFFEIEKLHFLSPNKDDRCLAKNDLVIAEFRPETKFVFWDNIVIPFLPKEGEDVPFHAFVGTSKPSDFRDEFPSFFHMILACPVLWCQFILDSVCLDKFLFRHRRLPNEIEKLLIHLFVVRKGEDFAKEFVNSLKSDGSFDQTKGFEEQEANEAFYRYFEDLLKISLFGSETTVGKELYGKSMIRDFMRVRFEESIRGLFKYAGVHVGYSKNPELRSLDSSEFGDKMSKVDGIIGPPGDHKVFRWLTGNTNLRKHLAGKEVVRKIQDEDDGEEEEEEETAPTKLTKQTTARNYLRETQLVVFDGCSGGSVYPLRQSGKCEEGLCEHMSLGVIAGAHYIKGKEPRDGSFKWYNQYISWENQENQFLYHQVVRNSLGKRLDSMKEMFGLFQLHEKLTACLEKFQKRSEMSEGKSVSVKSVEKWNEYAYEFGVKGKDVE